MPTSMAATRSGTGRASLAAGQRAPGRGDQLARRSVMTVCRSPLGSETTSCGAAAPVAGEGQQPAVGRPGRLLVGPALVLGDALDAAGLRRDREDVEDLAARRGR